MQFEITDSADNWRKWGELVRSWIFNAHPLPKDTDELKQQLNDHQIAANIPGPKRDVDFYKYENGKVNIALPTPEMVTADESSLAGLSNYPLPKFYAIAFGPKAALVNLSPSEMLDFSRRRLGNYSIQECQ